MADSRGSFDGRAIWPSGDKPEGCRGCPLDERGGPFVPGHGDLDASLVVVGERPGSNEEVAGKPFVGASGSWLDQGLGGHRRGVFVTNVRKCLREIESPEDKREATRHCARAYLEPEFQALAGTARTVLVVGADAQDALVAPLDMHKAHGSTWNRIQVEAMRASARVVGPPLPPLVHTVVSTLHPAFAMRGAPQFRPSIIHAIARARAWSGRTGGPIMGFDFDLQPSPDDLLAYLDMPDPVALDVETDMEAAGEPIQICGFSTKRGHAMVVPWAGPYIEVARDFLGRHGVLKIGHNISFDRHAFRRQGVKVAPPLLDTIQACSLLAPPFEGAEKRRWLSLAACALRHLDGLAYWKEPDNPIIRAFYRASFPKLPDFLHARLYNGLDTAITRMLGFAVKERLEAEGMW